MPDRDDEKTGRIDIRPECKATFSGIERAMEAMTGSIQAVGSRVEQIGQAVARQDESQRGLWHEIRDEVNPVLRSLPEAFQNAVDRHETKCLASQKLMAKVTRSSSDHPRPAVTEVHRTFGLPSQELLKWLLYLGLLIGGALAGASGYTFVREDQPKAQKIAPRGNHE